MKSAVLLALVRLGLSFLSFRKFLWVQGRLMRKLRPGSGSAMIPQARIIWAVETASRHIPKCACLTVALTAQVLLSRHGQKSDLRIGVVKGAEKNLEAHAWLESEGRILVGALHDLSRYTPLPQLKI
jgi:hypothetical protein